MQSAHSRGLISIVAKFIAPLNFNFIYQTALLQSFIALTIILTSFLHNEVLNYFCPLLSDLNHFPCFYFRILQVQITLRLIYYVNNQGYYLISLAT